ASTIGEPVLNAEVHVPVFPVEQLIPEGVLVTVPLPSTWTVTVVVASERPPALPTPSANASISASAPQPAALRIEPRSLLRKSRVRTPFKTERRTSRAPGFGRT